MIAFIGPQTIIERLEGMNINLKHTLKKLSRTESLVRYFECSEPARFYHDYDTNIYFAITQKQNTGLTNGLNILKTRWNSILKKISIRETY